MQCKCGFENLPDAWFCARCGAALPSQPDLLATSSGSVVSTPTPAVSAPTKPKLGLRLVIVGVVVAAVAYWWFNRPDPDYVAEESGLYVVIVNGKVGYIDKIGTLVIQPAYDSGRSFNEGLAPVSQQKKWGYIDAHGIVVIQPQFDDASWFTGGMAPVKLGSGTNAQWGFIGKDGKYVINPQFKDVHSFRDGVAPVNVNEGWGFIDRSGTMVIKPHFESVGVFSEGLAPVKQSEKWGYIDKAGNDVVKSQFESAEPFSSGVALVRSGGKYGYIDHNGKFIINPQFEQASDFSHGFAIVRIAGKTGTIDKSGKFILNPGQVDIQLFWARDGVVSARTADGLGYVDKSGAWVVSPTSTIEGVGLMRGGVAAVTIAGESCYINSSGMVIWGTPKGKSLYTLEKERKEKIQPPPTTTSADASQSARPQQTSALKPSTIPRGANAWDVILPSSPEPYNYDPHISMIVGQSISIRPQCFKQQPAGGYKILLPTDPVKACGFLDINSLPGGDAGEINSSTTGDYATVCNRGQCTVHLRMSGADGRANYFKVSMQRFDR